MQGAEKRLRKMERILAINRELTSTLSLKPILQNIVQAAAELTDSESAGIRRGGNTARRTDPRQWEILQMVARGLTYKEISASLHLLETLRIYPPWWLWTWGAGRMC